MKKKILFYFELQEGHLNFLISIAKTIQKLNKDECEIWFLTNEEFKKKISRKLDNVNFLIYSRYVDEEERSELETTEQIIELFGKVGKIWEEKDRIKLSLGGGHVYPSLFKGVEELHPIITKLIKQLNPDLILIDLIITLPTATNLGIPFVNVLSGAPTLIAHHQLPPPRSALPSEYNEENRKKWDHFIKEVYYHPGFLKFKDHLNKWLKNEKSIVNLDNKYSYYSSSPYLNIYNYPAELDYVTDVVKLPGKWIRSDSAVVDSVNPFPIPEKLKNLPGKLIYFSVGSMASCYKPLMERLLKIFSEIPHRFIVSTGLIGEEYKLSENQYGEKFINQLAVLQTVDVFITHGGNNSLTEAFYFTKPMVLLPLFADQPDAVRVEEKGFGIKMDAFRSSKEEFENAIEQCLKKEIREKMKKVSNRIRSDNSLERACKSIIDLIM